ncbi:tRNA (adenosine(37)-N6)-threonylcarbamoyltransferase complex ATPase subunit type 1 TsaE [Cohnella caldifontis]|uniref:tRNA (adenosine(37)-N6)-threonylcarbamoyltransferase complex ATPase subunit type 1 TsaE n=1 Tax=Cohnella caldifontis TaxID=3027471 RepID=UPI0023EDA233|nr:tRNA (adenosine(37)-N6)-threonylcarbamoyltransferase complex ATPase subunit type 1 TsaE [Cohnella sp. YIM B05605]
MAERNDGRTPWYVREAESEEDTAAFAAALAEKAEPGSVLALDGDLGAGKTRFAQAFAAALGVPGTVNSPTFTIIKEYEGGRLPFYHMDVYRLSLEEADELGLDEYFMGEGVTLVEWASLIEPILPPERLHIVLEHTGPTSRRLRCRPVGGRYGEWCLQLGLTPEEDAES